MAFITFFEIIEILITIVGIGYLAMDLVGPTHYYGIEDMKRRFLNAAIIVSPAIVLHEFGHKIVAGVFHFNSVYHVNIFGLLIGVVFKHLGLPIIFVPAYVSILPTAGAVVSRLSIFSIAIAGPLTNLILFFASSVYLKHKPGLSEEKYHFVFMFKTVNKWLFFFNLLPLPGTDGMQALRALFG